MSTIRMNPRAQRRADFTSSYRTRLARQASATSADVDAVNEFSAALNERVIAVLGVATGKLDATTQHVELGSDPQVWWQAWQEFNELYVPEGLTIEQSESSEIPNYTMSCFIMGTPVWTDAGPVPIERIRPGDVVLSQDPETGELAFQPVLATTIRPPSPLLQIDVDGEAIVTTRGHRFWVNGQGWEMAKFLKPKMRLHAVDRSQTITAVEPFAGGDELEAYNLVVDGFHTYFVGSSQLLVLDNSCPRPTQAVVPGLQREEIQTTVPAEQWRQSSAATVESAR
jgi:hypothetical protein